MKKRFFTIGVAISMTLYTYGQLPPQLNNSNPNSNNFWSRAGNNQGNGGNVFGTRYNSPVYFYTGGTTALAANRRAKLNGRFSNASQYAINGYNGFPALGNVNTTGYFLLGQNLGAPGGNIYEELGAFSLLHLNGRDGTFVQDGGYRPWMKTGITFTDNNDMSYMGVRKVGSGTDLTETVVSWSDNQGSGVGPDDMVFRFTSGGNGNMNISNNLTTPNDLDGRHIARFAATGEFGLGNTFGVGSGFYVRPQSLLHMSLNGSSSVWSQFTNQSSGQNQNDGLRVGLLGAGANNRNGNALIYQQENRHLLFSTRANTNQVNTNNTRERVRVTSISAPTNLPGGGYGNYNPGNINGTRTRMSISHNPANPVTRPLSLSHLGYNTGNLFNPAATDGWRSWMDVGMFVSQGTDNMYFGLKDEGNDRYDAVINWGDNQGALGPFPIGPDNLRFVFTSTTGLGSGDPVSTSADGLEMGRFEPTQDQNGLANSFGKLGVGDFYSTPLPVTHKLHVRGNGRFEYIPEEAAESIILGKAIDPNNPDDVALRRLEFTNDPNDVLLGDGTWGTVNPTGGGAFVECTDNSGAADLNADSKVNLNNNQLYFENNDALGLNHVGIGYNCGQNLEAKLSVLQIHPATVNQSTTAISGINSDVTNDILNTYVGVYGEADGVHPPQLRPTNIGGFFAATGAVRNWAMKATIENNPLTSSQNVGLRVEVTDDQATANYGIRGNVRGAVNSSTVGTYMTASGSFTNSPGLTNETRGGVFAGHGAQNRNVGVIGSTSGFAPGFTDPQVSATEERFGVMGFAKGAAGGNYAVYGETDTSFPNSYAGYFAGPVVMNQASIWSDENLKENIDQIEDTDSIMELLNPVSFDYKQTGDGERLNLPSGKRMGFLAQQVEQVFPQFVTTARHPAELDSIGNIVNPAFDYKVLDMQQFVPFLVKDAQSKSDKIESLSQELAQKDSLLNDVNARLTQLENCLSNLLPILCQINNSAIQQNDEKTQEALLHQIEVELFDGENIILEQNIPNPFAERTVINYSIPATVGEAKLLFYNNEGRMIKEVAINERGAGQVNVFGAELSKGIYSYTLICDGKVVSTKKMVKQ